MKNKNVFLYIIGCILSTLLLTFTIIYFNYYANNKIENTDKQIQNETNIADESSEIIEMNEENINIENYKNCGIYTISSYTHIDKLTVYDDYVCQGIASSKDIKIGSTIYIEGVGKFMITDNNTKENEILIFLNNEQSCKEFGTRIAEVYILED